MKPQPYTFSQTVEAVLLTSENVADVVKWLTDQGFQVEECVQPRNDPFAYDIDIFLHDNSIACADFGDWIVVGQNFVQSFSENEFRLEGYQLKENEDINPLNEIGVIRTRTEAMTVEIEALYQEALRLARIADRQEAELHALRAKLQDDDA